MTNKEALTAAVNFPFDESKLDYILIKREVTGSAVFDKDTELTDAFQLAKADLYMVLVTTPNISEGGVSISLAEKETLKKMANDIYEYYDEVATGISVPTIKNKSHLW